MMNIISNMIKKSLRVINKINPYKAKPVVNSDLDELLKYNFGSIDNSNIVFLNLKTLNNEIDERNYLRVKVAWTKYFKTQCSLDLSPDKNDCLRLILNLEKNWEKRIHMPIDWEKDLYDKLGDDEKRIVDSIYKTFMNKNPLLATVAQYIMLKNSTLHDFKEMLRLHHIDSTSEDMSQYEDLTDYDILNNKNKLPNIPFLFLHNNIIYVCLYNNRHSSKISSLPKWYYRNNLIDKYFIDDDSIPHNMYNTLHYFKIDLRKLFGKEAHVDAIDILWRDMLIQHHLKNSIVNGKRFIKFTGFNSDLFNEYDDTVEINLHKDCMNDGIDEMSEITENIKKCNFISDLVIN